MKELLLRLNENVDDHTSYSEAHLLNKYDYKGEVPEFNPYSLESKGYVPLTKLSKRPTSTTSSLQFEPSTSQKIDTTNLFKEMIDHNKTIFLEINDKSSGKTQLLRLPVMKFLKMRV